MSDVITYQRFWNRRGTAAEWSSANPVLASGELGFETDTARFKIGNGSTVWNSLAYYSAIPIDDPSQNSLIFWDESLGRLSYLGLGSGLSITSGGQLDATGASGGGVNPATEWDEYHEMVSAIGLEFNANAGVTFTGGVPGHPGIASITSTGTGAFAMTRSTSPVTASPQIKVGGGALTFESVFEIPTLFAGVNTGQIRLGFADHLNGGPSNGIYCQYDNTVATWRLASRSASVETVVNGPTTVTTGWHYCKVVVNDAGTSAQLFVDGIIQGTVNTNIPSAGFTYGAAVNKTAGSTNAICNVDMMRCRQVFTTARY